MMTSLKRPRVGGEESGADYGDRQTRATLRFIVSAAAQLALPSRTLAGGRTVGSGYLFEFDDGPASAEDVEKVSAAMKKLIAEDLPIETAEMDHAEALALFVAAGLTRSAALVRSRATVSVSVHILRAYSKLVRLSLVQLLPRTSSLASNPPRLLWHEGLLAVTYGEEAAFSASLLFAAKDLASWGAGLGVDCVGKLNALQASGREQHDFILQAEFRQEAIIGHLAAAIAKRCDEGDERRVGVVCIAGPTSSGKTTFATKLTMYLRNRGYVGKALTVDHYYLPLDRQPKYQARKLRSDVDYDAIESMDAELVNEHINGLLEGKRVMAPVYNMKTGYRDGEGVPTELPAPVDKSMLIIEGIHALNPEFLRAVPRERVFKVYISPLSALQLDEVHALKTTDNRLIRRMSRDYLFRGHTASRTLSMWANVRRGEHRWIFPHQDAVDFVVNSAHEYEMMVLKPLVEPLLASVPPTDAQYAKARELLELIALFNPASAAKVPTTSLLREFIGDGCFDCH